MITSHWVRTALLWLYSQADGKRQGDVWWLNREQAFEQGLVSTNAAGNVIIKVDNSTDVKTNEKRNTVRSLYYRLAQ